MIDQSNSPSICVIGNLNIDLIIRSVPGLPAWGQEVMGASHIQVSSGQAGYLGFALSRLGIPVSLIGNVGEDIYGRQILGDLRSYAIDTVGVIVMPGESTGITVAIVRSDGERAFVSDLGSLHHFSEAMIEQSWPKVKAASIVCLVGLFCIPGLSYQAAARQLARARQAGVATMLDTGWDPHNWNEDTLLGMKELLKEVTLFMPNWDEARAITHSPSLEEAALALQALGPHTVVIKCGELGSFVRSGSHTCQAPPRCVQVYDAVGAGDVFNAGFLFGLRIGWSMEACLAFGNTTASLYISRQQDRFPRLHEVITTGRQDYPALAAIQDL
jgi:sugar/nucleoside kinase (ribokinase family)